MAHTLHLMARPMLRGSSYLYGFLLATSVAGAGCLGSFDKDSDPPGGDGSAEEAAARAQFESEVQPMLMGSCVACHASIGGAGPGFLSGAPDIYGTVRGWPNLVLGGNPASSRLYAYSTSSSHARVGVNLTDAQADIVRRWIEIVPETVGGGLEVPGPETPLYTPIEGLNTIELAGVAEGLTGASITFTADQLAAGLLMTQITVTAGAGGVHIKHPLFTTWCGGQGTPVNSLEGLDFTVEPNLSAPLGPGTLSLSSFRSGCQLSLSFELLEPSSGGPGGVDGGGPLGGGCMAVASYTANARGQIEQRCGGCHANAANPAKNAWDQTMIGDLSEAAQTEACGQALGNVNLATPDMSSLFNRVRPGQATGHPITLNAGDFDTFQAAILAWIADES